MKPTSTTAQGTKNVLGSMSIARYHAVRAAYDPLYATPTQTTPSFDQASYQGSR